MNESCLNFLGVDIVNPRGKAFAEKVLTHMRQKLADFQYMAGLYAKRYGPYEWKRDAFPGMNFPEGRQIGFIAQRQVDDAAFARGHRTESIGRAGLAHAFSSDAGGEFQLFQAHLPVARFVGIVAIALGFTLGIYGLDEQGSQWLQTALGLLVTGMLAQGYALYCSIKRMQQLHDRPKI